MNAHLLIDAVVQQTMVFIAELATAGGVRAPLAHVAEQVFRDLTQELTSRGVRKKVIADMFGMALRTYHRRVRELGDSRTEAGKTVWEAVLGFIREREPVSGREVQRRFSGDDPEVVAGVLSDLTHSGLVYRAGRGDEARYRIAEESDFTADDDALASARAHLVWLSVYRTGPTTEAGVRAFARLGETAVRAALASLVREGRVVEHAGGTEPTYTADRFEVPIGSPSGWEAAVLDHYQALVSAVIAKLRTGRGGRGAELSGGSTWSLDVWPGHPLESECKTILQRTRRAIEDLRVRVDSHNAGTDYDGARERVVFYAGQYVRDTTSFREMEET